MNVEISEPQTAYAVEGRSSSRDDWRPLSLEAPVPAGGAQAAHPASAGNVQRESFAGCAGMRDRPQQFVPL